MASDANSRSTPGPAPRATPQPVSPQLPSASRASRTGGVGVAVAAGASQFDAHSTGGGRQGPPRWQGKRIGRYKLVAEIGRGAMGRVFRAEDEVLGNSSR